VARVGGYIRSLSRQLTVTPRDGGGLVLEKNTTPFSVINDTPRSAQAVEHVEGLIHSTRNSGLPKSEKDSLLGSLSRLKQDSISRRGKALIDEQIGEKEYDDKAAKDFFQHCYYVRSDLVHNGAPSDESLDVGRLVTQLDQLVADLMVAIIR
jgi:hypothetical protein